MQMKCFKIESIEYGWFEYRIGKHYVEASDYLGYDVSREFLFKLLKMLKGSSKEWIYVMNEPGAGIMELSLEGDKIFIRIYSLNKPSFDLSKEIEEEIKNIGECKCLIDIPKTEFVDAIVTEYALYETGNARDYYETNWGDFPQVEYNELKKIAFELNKNLSEIDSMQCVDFLKLYSKMNCFDNDFWAMLDSLVHESEIVIDRPKGTAHPKYPDFIYKVDYGYLKNTSSMDGAGIDVWVGSGKKQVDAIMCTVDLLKRDSEIKILIGCTEEEKQLVYQTHNETQYMKGIMVRR